MTSGPVISEMSPSTSSSRPCATGERAAASSRASRTSALPLAYCSQQPRLPHSQRWPPGTTCMCPNSPATPNRPRYIWPSTSTAPPMPVPRLMHTMVDSPWPAPNRASAQSAALASFSTTTGSPVRRCIALRSGSCRHDRCGAKSTDDPVSSTKPAAPMPMAIASRWSQSSRSSAIASAMMSSTTCGLWVRCGVSRRARRSTRPSTSTSPAATFVPPMSMPIAGRDQICRVVCDRGSLTPRPSPGRRRRSRPPRCPARPARCRSRVGAPCRSAAGPVPLGPGR